MRARLRQWRCVPRQWDVQLPRPLHGRQLRRGHVLERMPRAFLHDVRARQVLLPHGRVRARVLQRGADDRFANDRRADNTGADNTGANDRNAHNGGPDVHCDTVCDADR